MYNHFHHSFQKLMYIIKPGEFYATKDDVILSTVLGSCISVILYDEKSKVAGLNHFMLPGNKKGDEIPMVDAKYGIHAMELLINAMYKQGASKERLKAKVFGGGSVLAGTARSTIRVPEENIEFTFAFLQTERIPVISSDVGGNRARKIFLFPSNFRVILKRLSDRTLGPVKEEETLYLQNLREKIEHEKEKDNWIIFPKAGEDPR